MPDGLLVEVTETNRGSQTTQPAAAGDTVLHVEDTTDFPDTGTIEIPGDDDTGQRYDYTAVAADDQTSLTVDSIPDDGSDTGSPTGATGDMLPTTGGTLTLTTALATSVDEDTPVWLVVGDAPATDAYALVDQQQPASSTAPDGGDTLRIPLTYEQRVALAPGVYDPPVPVTLTDDLTGLINVPGVKPTVDGTLIDPSTLPQPGTPTDPPASTPALTVSAGPDFFVLRVDNAAADWAAMSIEYHVSTDPTFTPTADDPATLVGSSRGVMITNVLPDGTQYALGTQYFFSAIATNTAGAAPATTPIGAQLDPTAVTNIVAAQIVAGYILTGRIEFGQGYIDADEGIVLPQPDGTVTRFPVDGITPATISGFLIANGMTVKSGAYFYGVSEIAGGGKLQLAAGVPDPSAAPTITTAWDYRFSGFKANNDDAYGLCVTTAKAWFLTFSGASGTLAAQMLQYSPTITTDNSSTIRTAVIEDNSTFTPRGGGTIINGTLYLCGQDSARSNAWYIYAYSESDVLNNAGTSGRPAKTGEWLITTNLTAYAGGFALGTDGTDLILGYCTSKTLRAQRRPTSAPNTVTQTVCQVTVSDNYTMGAVWAGSGWLVLVPRAGVSTADPTNAWVIATSSTSTATSVYSQIALPASSGNSSCNGFIIDNDAGTFWLTTAGTSGIEGPRIYKFRTITNGTITAAYTWYDGDTAGTGVHETASSPTASVAWPAGRNIATVAAKPAPHAGVTDVTQTDKANRVRIYANYSAPGQPGAAPGLQTTLADGVTNWNITWQNYRSGAAAPTTSNFGGSNVGVGEISAEATDTSGKPLVDLKGDGSWRLGNLSGSVNGTVTDATDTGWLTLPLATGYEVYQTETPQYRKIGNRVFLRGRFQVTGHTAFPTTGFSPATLPAGFRPSTNYAAQALAAGSGVRGRMYINASGVITVQTADAPTEAWLNMTFLTD